MTFKEFMHTPNPALDQIAIEAEVAREIAEDIAYDRRIEMKDKTLNQLLAEADARSKAQDAHNNRERIPTTNEKENNTMNENKYNEDYVITGPITSTIMNFICTKAVEYNKYPVDFEFKLNNLNETEFKFYALQLMRYVYENPFDVIEYPTQQERNKKFYDFRAKNKHLVDDSRKVAPPIPQKKYPIPTDTDIKFRNDAELLALAMHTIEELSSKLLLARECVKNDIELVDLLVTKLPKPRKSTAK